MEAGLQVDSSEWVRVCREHNAICLIIPGVAQWSRDRVLCPYNNGHELVMDCQWKVCRRGQPYAAGWDGGKAPKGQEG